MYASQVQQSDTDPQKLTFFVSGKLWGRSLVMQDRETGSEWSHILGRAMEGKLKGTKLTIIPSVMTTWGRWKQDHPNTTVTTLSHVLSDFTADFLKTDSDRFGLGLVHGSEARFWRFANLLRHQVVNDKLADLPVVVYFDVPSRTPVAWSRRLTSTVETDRARQLAEVSSKTTGDGDSTLLLTFRETAQSVQDAETQSIWNLRNGTAIAGPLRGTQLRSLPAIVSFSNAWHRFHPETTEWTP